MRSDHSSFVENLLNTSDIICEIRDIRGQNQSPFMKNYCPLISQITRMRNDHSSLKTYCSSCQPFHEEYEGYTDNESKGYFP